MSTAICRQCQGDIIAPRCVQIEYGEYDSLEDYVEDIGDRVVELEKNPSLDFKDFDIGIRNPTSTQVLQFILDNLTPTSSSTTSNSTININNIFSKCDLDWKDLINCNDCVEESFCAKFQVLIDIVDKLKKEHDIW